MPVGTPKSADKSMMPLFAVLFALPYQFVLVKGEIKGTRIVPEWLDPLR
ncbi:MAG: sortase B protein-sorting domain-containing protein [Anaerolineae bacterium]|nr:sortase B protein-sorting domain-containing protein [Anaerolineae bacterium]